MDTKTTSIRQLHSRDDLGWARSCFYQALEQSVVDYYYGPKSLDDDICFTINGVKIDFLPLFKHFEDRLDEYVNAKASKMLDSKMYKITQFLRNTETQFQEAYSDLMQDIDLEIPED